ncbi:Arm DNA-binding domain-containing protein [Oleiagrimonas soli]|uniref:Arm DNA-binding domain-containing protein n=1 Tax=Oleiagrimonas soli TaxID=1543381 RepID=UPI0030845BC6
MLTDTKLRSLKPKPRSYRLTAFNGLCIEVRSTGAKVWRYSKLGERRPETRLHKI